MKKVITLILVIVCIASLFTACSSKSLSIEEADYIVLKNEKDNISVKVTDVKIVEKIIDDFNSLSLKKGELVQVPSEWSYQLIWYDNNNKILGVIGIIDDSILGYNDYYYSIIDGNIDIDFFDKLFDRE